MTPASPIYAGRAERFLAFLIDRLLVSLLASFPLGIFANGRDEQMHLVMPVLFVTSALYYSYSMASKWQATPGKRLLGIYVARTDHHALTKRDAFERFLAFSLPTLPAYTSFFPEFIPPFFMFMLVLFWYAPILYTDERTAFHDKLCKTRVLIGKVGV